MILRWRAWGVAGLVFTAGACGDNGTQDDGAVTDVGSSTGDDEDETEGAIPAATFENLCNTDPPAGATLPPSLPVYDGVCPTLEPGRNTIVSSEGERELVLVVPKDLEPGERVPVFFLWHWLGGSANSFIERGDVQAAADAFRFVAVAPEEKGDLGFRWPFTTIESDERLEEELRFFDDMLACVAEQYSVNESCVSTVGVSAGALWSAQLAQRRGEYLSSFLSLSGGTGTEPVRPWNGSSHVMPAMVLWGGPTDRCIINFDEVSRDLGAGLDENGHLVLECVHNCAHGQPPFDVETSITEFEPLWLFALNHPYWLEPGTSPWQTGSSIPPEMPVWCALGVGNAEIRDGECGPSQC